MDVTVNSTVERPHVFIFVLIVVLAGSMYFTTRAVAAAMNARTISYVGTVCRVIVAPLGASVVDRANARADHTLCHNGQLQ